MSYEQAGADQAAAPPEKHNAPAPVDPTTRRVRFILGVAAVLIVGLVLGRLVSGDDTTEEATSETASTEGEIAFPTGDVNRTGYWGFVNLEPVVIDTFDRANNPQSLGSAGTGQEWEAVSGTWGIRGNAALTPGSGGGPRLAVITEGRGDGLLEVTMTVVEDGAGLVFNYADAEDYWSVTANLGLGSWSVNRVTDGEAVSVGELAGSTADGTTISVEQKGTALRFLVEGVEYLAVPDGAVADQLQGGMIAAEDSAGEARWNRFLVMAYGDEQTTTTTAPD